MFFSAKTVFAQTFSKVANNPTAGPLILGIVDNILIPLVEGLFVLAAVYFVYGVYKMISKGDDPDARKEGQKHVFWGLVGMFIMISSFGIIRLIANTIGVHDPFF